MLVGWTFGTTSLLHLVTVVVFVFFLGGEGEV
jgi:hypothetical protein